MARSGRSAAIIVRCSWRSTRNDAGRDANRGRSPTRHADVEAAGTRAMVKPLRRCGWANVDDPLMIDHHDREWGVANHDDRRHFEFLLLESAQAGLSWAIVLKKREGYRRAFADFDPTAVARFTQARIGRLAA